ncbi:MAG: TIR domain-containing protein [Gallionella sp.]|nr:TIR domain-containing protein [Gallionella sp.]MDD4959148.1 TIR domain-containing protein [Gallionella sp.]
MSQKINVFISYSHDSDAHREQVLALSNRLREDGIETQIDQYLEGSPKEGWPRWMLKQLKEAQFVLMVCTETYYRRFCGHEEPNQGKGVDWEGTLITQELYDSRSQTLKFVPVFLNDAVQAHIPEPLRSISHYALTTDANYQNLYDFLLGQAGAVPHPVGTLKYKPRKQGGVLQFDDSPPTEAAKVDISRIDKYAPEKLIGREAETKLLDDAWHQVVNGKNPRPHVLTLVALGGEGKTSLVAKWAATLAHHDWSGCAAVFAWSFYSQGTKEQTAASSDLFLDAALGFFGDQPMADSAKHASEKGKRLAQLVGATRTLLILDGVEPLQYAPTSTMAGELKDAGLAALLKGLAANSHGLCVVTTRYTMPDLKAYRQTTAPEIPLLRLSREAGVALLQYLDVKGSLIRNIPFGEKQELVNEFEMLVEDVQGHALTLNLLGGFLKRAFKGDIRQRDRVKFDKADNKTQGGHAFRTMTAYEQWLLEGGDEGCREVAILRLMGLFDRPADAGCIYALRETVIPDLTEVLVGLEDEDWEFCLTGLEGANLLTVNREAGALLSLDAHPLLREYFAKQLREQHPDAFRAAHRQLYQHLCATTQEGKQPSLADLQPLYQAVAHGCLAGMQQQARDEVYSDRIQRGQENYSAFKLGAFGTDLGAITCFFDTPWSRVSSILSPASQGWLLNAAAFRLSALGRLGEAVEPMRTGLVMSVKQEQWENAAASACNLSELELTMGRLDVAESDAAQSVCYAALSDVAFWKMASQAKIADALHQAGRVREAMDIFAKAEEIQVKHQFSCSLLCGLQGFKYCDLLLTAAERAAWRAFLPATILPSPAPLPMPSPKGRGSFHGAGGEGVACRAVSERATQTLKWAEQNNASLLAIAFDHLTLGRAALYAALREGSSPSTCHASIQHAVDGLRRAGQQQYLPLALLTRAWLRMAELRMAELRRVDTTLCPRGEQAAWADETCPPDDHCTAAQADLNEALEIAERGPMPLYLADIYLHRARLFCHITPYPWRNPDGTVRSAKEDLAEARRLIEKHGYGRRKAELEDAEAVIGK